MRTFKIGNLVATVPGTIVCGTFPSDTFSHVQHHTLMCMRSYQMCQKQNHSCFSGLDDADGDTLSQLKSQLSVAMKTAGPGKTDVQKALTQVKQKIAQVKKPKK